MYAIVDVAGKQFKVSKGDNIRVPKLEGAEGKSISLDKVLLISDKGKVAVGKPTINGATVKAKIEGFGRDKKILVFKRKRRKGYRVKNGHRQDYTDLTITTISQTKATAKKETAKKSGEAKDGA